MKNNVSKHFKRSLVTAAVLSILGANIAVADDLLGDVTIGGNDHTGYKVKAVNVDTGQTRTVNLKKDGSYRLAKMPSGTYIVTVSKEDTVYAEAKVRSMLGANTVTNFEVVDSNDTEVIQIVGSSMTTIDVSSSDSGLTVGEVEIDRMPIARNLTAVALYQKK
jgi:VCBS repeat-containing protein